MSTTLAAQIGAVHEGNATPDALRSAFRAASLVVAMTSPTEAMTVEQRGLTWVCAFTSTTGLARFAAARGEGDREWSFRVFTGAELADACVEGGPFTGVALDLAGERPLLLPAPM